MNVKASLFVFLTLLPTACAGAPAPRSRCPSVPTSAEAPPRSVVPLGLASGQFHTIPLRVSGHVLTVGILDTGIGLALVSKALCERVGCEIDGEFTGQRMSGQAVTIPLTHLESLEVGGIVQENVLAGVIDIEGFFPEPQIEAFVGLPFFEDSGVPFTIDVGAEALVLESPDSLARREEQGTAIPVRLDRHGPALDIFVPVVMGQIRAEMLMDTGSRSVILDMRFAEALSLDLDAEGVRRREGQDETGQGYERFFTTLEELAFESAPSQTRHGMSVMFQDIIHDGLLGKEFLSSFMITYDIGRARILVAAPEE